jgi:hypothetical protein
MFGSVQKTIKSQGKENPGTSSVKPKAKQVGRERLQYFSQEISKANEAIESLEENIARLNSITVESEDAQRKLQAAISSDGGLALAAYSAGKTKPDDPISQIIAHAKSSGEAAAAAKMAMPHAEASLQDARSQLVTLTEQKHAELNHVIEMLADRDARDYQSAFNAACMAHDRLCGYAAVMEGNIGSLRLIHDPIKMPRFALPSMGTQDADQYIRHSVSDLTVNESARRWSAIKARLESNVDADISDLN